MDDEVNLFDSANQRQGDGAEFDRLIGVVKKLSLAITIKKLDKVQRIIDEYSVKQYEGKKLYKFTPEVWEEGKDLLLEFPLHGGSFAVFDLAGEASLCIPHNKTDTRIYTYKSGQSMGTPQHLSGQNIAGIKVEKTAQFALERSPQ